MNEDERRALAICAVLLSSVSGSAGFLGGRMSVESPPAEVKLVRLPPRVLRVPVADAPVEPVAASPAEPSPPAPAEPETAVTAPVPPVETQPLPPPRPQVQAKPEPKPQAKAPSRPQPKPEKPAPKKLRHPAPTSNALPPCAVVQREYDAMTWSQRMSAYHRATPEEIAHGKRCLGF